MSKNLFTIPSSTVLEAANLLEGRSRFLQLKADVEGMERVGVPIELSDKRKLIMHVDYGAFIRFVDSNIKDIEDELDRLGVSYNG